MAIDLMALEPQKISRNLRGKFALFFGLPGVGKTSLAAQFPKALIASFEQGTNALNNVYVQPVKTWNDWKQMVSQLVRKEDLKSKYETICVDTADSAWDLCVKYICSQNGVEQLSDIPWGRGFDMAKKEYQNGFRDLTFSGYGLIFISHSIEKTLKNEKGEEYQQIVPALPQRPYDIVNKMVDLIGYIREIETEDGGRRRYIFFRGDDRFFAKSRFRYIEPRVEFNYENIVNAIYDAIDKEVAASGGEITNDENPYTTLDFDSLMEDAKILWGKVIQEEKADDASKILQEEFGRPIRFSEITADQVEKLNIVIMRIKDIL